MTTRTRIPVNEIVALHSAIEQALAQVKWNGPAPNKDLWDALNHARSVVRVYLLIPAGAVNAEIIEPVEVTA